MILGDCFWWICLLARCLMAQADGRCHIQRMSWESCSWTVRLLTLGQESHMFGTLSLKKASPELPSFALIAGRIQRNVKVCKREPVTKWWSQFYLHPGMHTNLPVSFQTSVLLTQPSKTGPHCWMKTYGSQLVLSFDKQGTLMWREKQLTQDQPW